jgi:hypothetical protein
MSRLNLTIPQAIFLLDQRLPRKSRIKTIAGGALLEDPRQRKLKKM